mgnify:CR=1 FL=1
MPREVRDLDESARFVAARGASMRVPPAASEPASPQPQLSYAHCSTRVWPAAHALLRHCVDRLPPGSSLLELGSGTGWFGDLLATQRPDLTIVLTEMPQYGAFAQLDAAVSSLDEALALWD